MGAGEGEGGTVTKRRVSDPKECGEGIYKVKEAEINLIDWLYVLGSTE